MQELRIPEIEVDSDLRRHVRINRPDLEKSFPRAYRYAKELKRSSLGTRYSRKWSEEHRTTLVTSYEETSFSYRHDQRIVHGLAFGRPYAWVEIEDVLFDPGHQRFFDRAEWYAATAAVKKAEYTTMHAETLLNQTHSYGPWTGSSDTEIGDPDVD